MEAGSSSRSDPTGLPPARSPIVALEVHQFVPSLLLRDAVGNHVVQTQAGLRREGLEARIWAADIQPQLRRLAQPYGRFARLRTGRGRQRVLVYQAASWSAGLVDFMLEQAAPSVISYHNLTPPEFFAPYDSEIATSMRRAHRELARLAERGTVAVAASTFNAADLHRMGIADVRVIPPHLGPGLRARPNQRTLAELRATRRGIDLLFVGRLVPNKGHFHLVRLLATLRAAIDPCARLFLVGAPGPDLYMHSLRRCVDRLAPGAVILTGAVPDDQLAAYYAHASAFVCLSDHEGFGIPLIEAMRAHVPVVAYAAGAVAETMGGAGVVVGTREPASLAEVVARVAGDQGLRAQLVERQVRRARELERFPREPALVDALTKAVG